MKDFFSLFGKKMYIIGKAWHLALPVLSIVKIKSSIVFFFLSCYASPQPLMWSVCHA